MKKRSGFSIIELIVVVVVIGILATLTVVGYDDVMQSAVETSLKSDLSNISKQLELYKGKHGSYPKSMNTDGCMVDWVAAVDTNFCYKGSNDSVLSYSAIVSRAYRLVATKDSVSFMITNSTQAAPVRAADDSQPGVACPNNFIPVPGSGTYGTNDFCVMKYEAKHDTDTVPTTMKEDSPWNDITQADAIIASQKVNGCEGCHLISEAEWMTIAQNVLSVNTNWSGGSVGSGYVYRGNSQGRGSEDDASTDNDGYYKTGSYAGDMTVTCGYGVTGDSQRRTLSLTNGQIIWDIAGNRQEWTSGTVTTGQPGVQGEGSDVWSWLQVNTLGSLAVNPSPAGTGLIGASSWNENNGMGYLVSDATRTNLTAFYRGGNDDSCIWSGVTRLSLKYSPTGYEGSDISFRVAQ